MGMIKTIGLLKSIHSFYAEKEYPSVIQSTSTEDEQPHKSGLRHLPLHGHAWSEGEQTDGIENTEQILAERDALANAFTWGTTTQRYDSVQSDD